GQIGYNWQLSPIWVVGLEADIQGALESSSGAATSNFSGFVTAVGCGGRCLSPTTVVGSTVLDYQTKIEWFGTVRGGLGYVWGDGNVMSYLTGGLAYGKVDWEGTSTLNLTANGATFQSATVTTAFGHNAINTGWVVGYGTEGKLLIPGWTLKAEYLYMDLGHLDATGSGVHPLQTGLLRLGATAQVTAHSHFTDGILRVGLNYQFH